MEGYKHSLLACVCVCGGVPWIVSKGSHQACGGPTDSVKGVSSDLGGPTDSVKEISSSLWGFHG